MTQIQIPSFVDSAKWPKPCCNVRSHKTRISFTCVSRLAVAARYNRPIDTKCEYSRGKRTFRAGDKSWGSSFEIPLGNAEIRTVELPASTRRVRALNPEYCYLLVEKHPKDNLSTERLQLSLRAEPEPWLKLTSTHTPTRPDPNFRRALAEHCRPCRRYMAEVESRRHSSWSFARRG